MEDDVYIPEIKNIKIKRLSDLAVIPSRGSLFAAGYDLYAAIEEDAIEIPPHETVKIKTDIAFELPHNTFLGIFPRSGLATKQGLRPANCVGVIDADYRGNIIVALHNDSNETQEVKNEERIAQAILLPYFQMKFEEVDELEETERGEGGFGSTGIK